MKQKLERPNSPKAKDFITEQQKSEIGRMLKADDKGREALFSAMEACLFEIADIRSLDLKSRESGNVGFVAASRYWTSIYLSEFFQELAGFISGYEEYLLRSGRELPDPEKEYV